MKLERAEQRMAELAKKDEPVLRRVLPRDEAVAYFKGLGEHYKAEIIASIPSNEPISLYGQGGWVDLCRGPHVPSTGKIKVFKLMKLAGAYWRGNSKNEMLQRVYGTAFMKKEELEAYLHMLEEAEKRDHRKLGQQLDLFHMQDEAPGSVFWHPKGWRLFQSLINYMRQRQEQAGYVEVNTPDVMAPPRVSTVASAATPAPTYSATWRQCVSVVRASSSACTCSSGMSFGVKLPLHVIAVRSPFARGAWTDVRPAAAAE